MILHFFLHSFHVQTYYSFIFPLLLLLLFFPSALVTSSPFPIREIFLFLSSVSLGLLFSFLYLYLQFLLFSFFNIFASLHSRFILLFLLLHLLSPLFFPLNISFPFFPFPFYSFLHPLHLVFAPPLPLVFLLFNSLSLYSFRSPFHLLLPLLFPLNIKFHISLMFSSLSSPLHLITSLLELSLFWPIPYHLFHLQRLSFSFPVIPLHFSPFRQFCSNFSSSLVFSYGLILTISSTLSVSSSPSL